ncbi:MAG: NAD(P)/FAD-dependent oxidoreductase [Candidatus Binatia bacterium]
MENYDAIIIGAGHNGLVTSAYLARAGKKVLVLERRSLVGGIAATEEIFPGFKYSTCAHLAGSFSSEISAELELQKHGLKILPLDPLLFAPALEGNSLLVPRDPAKIVEEIGRHSKADAGKYSLFCALINKLAAFLRSLNSLSLPNGTSPGNFNLTGLVTVGFRFHRLGKKEMYEFMRILPMSVADLLNEWFESETLKAAIAASGILNSFVGPRAQGTAYAFLHHLSGQSNGAFRTAGVVSGGIHQLPQALARSAQQYGAEIRTGAEVAAIATKNGAATGVFLANGDEISAKIVISNADVKRTLLNLVEPTYLDPHFLLQVRNIRSRGTVAKINFALDSLPSFRPAAGNAAAARLGGIIHIGPTLDYLERAADDAKYGRFSQQPFLEITIPSVIDPSLAPAGRHVMSVWMQSAPYHLREKNWNEQRDALGDSVANVIESYAPGFKNLILHRQVVTPLDLEQTFGVTGGHLDHAELGLDQIFFMRPVPGWAGYGTPIENLYLCGSGTHPGGGITGLPGSYAAKKILKSWPHGK